MKPQRDLDTLLGDVSTACELVVKFTAGKTFQDYSGDDMLRSAVERQFTIIGEALREAWKLEPTLSDRITDLRDIVDFRNLLVPGYSVVFDPSVWRIAETTSPSSSPKFARCSMSERGSCIIRRA